VRALRGGVEGPTRATSRDSRRDENGDGTAHVLNTLFRQGGYPSAEQLFKKANKQSEKQRNEQKKSLTERLLHFSF